jgi:allantoinase
MTSTMAASATCRKLPSKLLQPVCETFLLWGGKLVSCGSGPLDSGSILVDKNGRIESCHPSQSEAEAIAMASAKNISMKNMGGDAVISPGLIDVHCHISGLGRNWEGYYSCTRAAAAGGITTIMGMPLNSLPPTTTKAAFEMEVDRAVNTSLMADVGLWGGVVPESLEQTDELLNSCGIFGIKAFLAPLPESAGYQAVPPSTLGDIAKKCGRQGIPVLVHSELMTAEEAEAAVADAFSREDIQSDYEAHLASRPTKWERDAIEIVCDLSDNCHMHIVHLSDAESLDLIRETKSREGTSLTVETCPHYLLLDSETTPMAMLTKCFPPIRDSRNRLRLWNDGIQTGLVDMLASDHSPCTPDLRQKPMREAWGGIAGLQYQLQASTTAMKSTGLYTDTDDMLVSLAGLWSERPAKLVPGFENVKGKLKAGMQADVCVWYPDYVGKPADTAQEHHRWKGDSPFSTMDLNGKVVATFVSGQEVYNGESDSFLDDTLSAGSLWVRNTH